MKKFSGWMIFWAICIVINIIIGIGYYNESDTLANNSIGQSVVPKQCMEVVLWMGEYIKNQMLYMSSIGTIILQSVILYLLYKHAPN
jgi:hypothetical protein